MKTLNSKKLPVWIFCLQISSCVNEHTHYGIVTHFDHPKQSSFTHFSKTFKIIKIINSRISPVFGFCFHTSPCINEHSDRGVETSRTCPEQSRITHFSKKQKVTKNLNYMILPMVVFRFQSSCVSNHLERGDMPSFTGPKGGDVTHLNNNHHNFEC